MKRSAAGGTATFASGWMSCAPAESSCEPISPRRFAAPAQRADCGGTIVLAHRDYGLVELPQCANLLSGLSHLPPGKLY